MSDPLQQSKPELSISRQNLLDFSWLQTRLINNSAFQLLQNFEPYLEDEPLQLLHGALQAAIHIISRDTSALNSQLFGRLRGYNIPEIQALLKQAEASSYANPNQVWLRPLTQSLKSPNAPLLFTLCDETSGSISGLAITPDGKNLISVGSQIRIWDLTFNEAPFDLDSESWGRDGVVVTPDNQYLIANKRASVRAWHIPTWQKADSVLPSGYHIPLDRYGENPIFISPNGNFLGMICRRFIVIFKLHSNDEPLVLASEGIFAIEYAAFAPDNNHIIAGSAEGDLYFWNLQDPHALTKIEGDKRFNAIAVKNEAPLAITAMNDKTLIAWDIQEKQALYTLAEDQSNAQSVTFTPDDQFALSGSGNDTINIWDLTQKTTVATIHSKDK